MTKKPQTHEVLPRSYLSQTKKLLRRFNLRARKGLGQHFLVDERVLLKIVSAAELTPDDTVAEIGPGLGVLTRELATRAKRVIAIEVDAKLTAVLTQTLSHFSNLTILNSDVLQTDPAMLLAGDSVAPSYKVIANLPYYITSPTLRHFLEASLKPRCMVVMIQKEVADSIVAELGKMSLLSVSIQFYAKPVIVDYVASESFYPRPKVDSAIVHLDVYQQPAVEVADIGKFFEVVRAGFSAPRKQLHNALSQGLWLPPQDAIELLNQADIAPQRRAQTLSLDEWHRVYQAIAQWRSKEV